MGFSVVYDKGICWRESKKLLFVNFRSLFVTKKALFFGVTYCSVNFLSRSRFLAKGQFGERQIKIKLGN